MPNRNNIFIKAAHKIGMDGAIAYSSAARIFQAFAGVITIYFIATFLTGEEQGFYYTFGSILAIQTFFELGFAGIMTQYVAHEVVHLRQTETYDYEGDEKYKSRLAYLVKFCLKWYLIVSILFFVVVNIVGIVYFNKYDLTEGRVSWLFPWLLISFSTSIMLFESPFTAILNGLGKVKEMNQIIFYQQLIVPIIQWGLFACGAKLFVVGVSSFISASLWVFFVFRTKLWRLVYNLLKTPVSETVSYMKEIFPYQWKIALSWVSGYFIFQLFNPVLFASEGAVVAGQMGMTLSVLNAIQAFSMSWQNTKIPRYSGLIEQKDYNTLDNLFNKIVKQMFVVCLTLLFGMFISVFILKQTQFVIHGTILGDRFLDYIPMLLMMIPLCVNMFVFSWATYLRCHKQEPFLANSIVMGLLCCLSTLILGRQFGVIGVTLGYCLLTLLVSLPWGYRIFVTKKREWHTAI